MSETKKSASGKFIDTLDDYRFVDVYDTKTNEELESIKIAAKKRFVDLPPITFSPHQKVKRCALCGAHLRYAALMFNTANNEAILVGETCVTNQTHKTAFKAVKKGEAVRRKREKISLAKKQMLIAHPELAILTYPELLVNHSGFVKDVAYKFKEYGPISDAQRFAVLEAIKKEFAREVEKEIAEANKKALYDSGMIKKAPSGLTSIVGEVLRISSKVNYTYGTSSWKVTVAHPDGYKVWGTIRSTVVNKFLRENKGKDEQALVGVKVAFAADLVPSDDDPFFAFARNVKEFTLLT